MLCFAHSPPRSRRRAVCCSKDARYVFMCVIVLLRQKKSEREKGMHNISDVTSIIANCFTVTYWCKFKTVILLNVEGYSLKKRM